MNLQKLTTSLTIDEGDKLTPYRDSRGLWTVGIGRCLESNAPMTAEWKWLLDNGAIKIALTEEGSQFLFANDVRMAMAQIKTRCDFWDRLDDLRQNILIEMCFQLGIDRLLGFNKMFAAMRIGDFTSAAKEGLDSAWAKQTPNRANKLMNSLKTGEWPK